MSRTERVRDLQSGLAVVLGCVLLGAPAGLLWSAVSPRVLVQVSERGPDIPDLESNKGFIGADGSYFAIMLVVGIVCGLLAWRFARRSGPITVLALAVGGSAAALIAAAVGVLPGADAAIDAVTQGSSFRGTTELYLGRLQGDAPALRAVWAFVAWPAGALAAFLAMATIRPGELE